ncbi:MAG: hypothetical protein Q7R88_01075, partial [bacterium]|nr:hypothetical protein [bacterium]
FRQYVVTERNPDPPLTPTTQLLDQGNVIVELERHFGVTVTVRSIINTTFDEVMQGMKAA